MEGRGVMGVRRTELAFEGQFTQIPNAWVRDERLSRKARGLLAEIMSHRVGWHVTTRSLAAAGPEGRHSILAGLSELVEAGYLSRAQGRRDGGRFGEIEYELSEPTVVQKSSHGEKTPDGTVVGFTAVGSSAVGESAPKNTISTEDHLEEPLSASADHVLRLLDVLWTLWPTSRRSTRKVVERSLRTALKSTDAPTLIEAVKQHTDVWSTWPASEVQYVPLLSTWLNQERWTGALPQPRGNGRLSAVDTGRAADAILSAVEPPHLRALS